MDIEGILIMDLPLEEGVSQRTGNTWKKKSWVLETMGQYPRKAKFDVFGDRVETFKQLEVGKAYSISVDVESREFNGRWYTDLRAFNFRPLDNVQPAYQQPAQGGYQQPAGPAFQQPASTAPAGPQFGQPATPAPSPLPAADATEDLPF